MTRRPDDAGPGDGVAGGPAGAAGAPLGPIRLEPNRPRQFYRAGGAGATFTHHPAPDGYRPEDWVGSTTPRFGSRTDGLTRLPDGRLLRDAVGAAPLDWLGPDHVDRYGDDVALLVKLLDAGERLPVHLHPSRSFARSHLGSLHGKTEAWVVVGTEGGDPGVWLGFRHDQDAHELAAWVSSQDTAALLGALNHVQVRPGDALLVPAGTPHAIGAGVFCIELQEPTDFSLNLEWAGFALPDGTTGQLGLSADDVLACVSRSALVPDALERLRTRSDPVAPATQALLPPAADPYFRAARLRPQPGITLDASFAVLVVTDGAGRLRTESGADIGIGRGETVLVPWAAGPSRLEGDVEVVRCQPPRSNEPLDPEEEPHDA